MHIELGVDVPDMALGGAVRNDESFLDFGDAFILREQNEHLFFSLGQSEPVGDDRTFALQGFEKLLDGIVSLCRKGG